MKSVGRLSEITTRRMFLLQPQTASQNAASPQSAATLPTPAIEVNAGADPEKARQLTQAVAQQVMF